MAVDPALVQSIQAYVDAVLDLASHFITRLRRYASFCRTLASHAVTAGTGSYCNMVASPTQSSATPAISQGLISIWQGEYVEGQKARDGSYYFKRGQ
ncbi:hypothetical protein COLO4_06328 [Corchorus olitorius]|uniref:Uncharacterized protein n=1 Tax=Corchorus olitorius TaxID=93759 RepID=A0A1R3KN84_9ROSI|nr:hypothetical protein COLO4_06328 [Corchorus olitorius]